MRAHQLYLGLFPPELTGQEDSFPLKQVLFQPSVRRFLTWQLHTPGRLQGGLLIGQQRGSTLEIGLASPMGYGGRFAVNQVSPLELDPNYVLGWTDCIKLYHPSGLDWVGNWLARADGTLGRPEEDVRWLRKGAQQGLVDDKHPLVVLGWNDGMLQGRAYVWQWGQVSPLECVWSQ